MKEFQQSEKLIACANISACVYKIKFAKWNYCERGGHSFFPRSDEYRLRCLERRARL